VFWLVLAITGWGAIAAAIATLLAALGAWYAGTVTWMNSWGTGIWIAVSWWAAWCIWNWWGGWLWVGPNGQWWAVPVWVP
jgi:hypothetical protein